MNAAVLDSAALLAWLWDEPGADQIDPILGQAVMSSVNYSEAAQKLARRGNDARATLGRVTVLGLTVVPFTPDDALEAAELWPHTSPAGLSLADRACLALAHARDLPAFTTDIAWSDIDTGTDVRQIR